MSKFSHISVFFSQYVPTAKICTFYHYCCTNNGKLNSVWTCALFHFVLNDSYSNYHPFYLHCKFSFFFKQDFCFSLCKYFMNKEIKILTNGLNLRMLNQSIVRFFSDVKCLLEILSVKQRIFFFFSKLKLIFIMVCYFYQNILLFKLVFLNLCFLLAHFWCQKILGPHKHKEKFHVKHKIHFISKIKQKI